MANSLLSYTDVELGLYENQTVSVVQKQGDDETRFLRITVLNNDGKEINLTDVGATFSMETSKGAMFLYSTYDDKPRVTIQDNKILIRFNQNMLADAGLAKAELLLSKDDTTISSTKFEIFIESAVNNVRIAAEATTEFKTLIDLVGRAHLITGDLDELVKQVEANEDKRKADFDKMSDSATGFVSASQSYAIGTGGVYRANDDKDNSKYYSEQSAKSAQDSATSEGNAKTYMDNSEDWYVWSKSYAIGDTSKSHTIIDPDTGASSTVSDDVDNSKYYCGQARTYKESAEKSEKNVVEIEKRIEDKIKATVFTVNFNTGELEYEAPSSVDFSVDPVTGELVWGVTLS